MSRYRGSVQRLDGRTVGKAAGDAMPFGMPRHAVVLAGLLGPTAWLLIGCGSGEDLVTTAAAPAGQPAGAVHATDIPLAPDNEMQSAKLDVTPIQRAFLDALSVAGVHPSSELQALSIGSSVCQAHAAGQSDQAVWDYIAPMVRSDVADGQPSAVPQTTSDLQSVTADYIRIATQRLC